MDDSRRDYGPTAEAMGWVFAKLATNPPAPEIEEKAIREAAHENGDRWRFRAAANAEQLLDRRKEQDDATFLGGIMALMREQGVLALPCHWHRGDSRRVDCWHDGLNWLRS